jgi:hypothetical protein
MEDAKDDAKGRQDATRRGKRRPCGGMPACVTLEVLFLSYGGNAMATQGKLEITIKINELPTDVTTNKHGWKEFKLDCGGRLVSIALRPRMWQKIEDASKQWPLWLAAITGGMGQQQGTGFILYEPAVQVFERKPREPEQPPPPPPPIPDE